LTFPANPAEADATHPKEWLQGVRPAPTGVALDEGPTTAAFQRCLDELGSRLRGVGPAWPGIGPVARAAQPVHLPDDQGHDGQEGDQQQSAARPAQPTNPPRATAAVLPTTSGVQAALSGQAAQLDAFAR
jgi:hypothetical protein